MGDYKITKFVNVFSLERFPTKYNNYYGNRIMKIQWVTYLGDTDTSNIGPSPSLGPM